MDYVDTITLKGLDRMTEDEFFHFCQANSELRIERNRHGEIVIMSPTGSRTGLLNSKINLQLGLWNDQYELGYIFDSSTGFRLPDGSERSPDAAWISRARWEALSREEQEKFAPVCPEFVVELRSPSDLLETLEHKMEHAWMANGCRLAWLIDPVEETAYVYRADGSRDEKQGFDTHLSGEDVLPNFSLDLSVLKDV